MVQISALFSLGIVLNQITITLRQLLGGVAVSIICYLDHYFSPESKMDIIVGEINCLDPYLVETTHISVSFKTLIVGDLFLDFPWLIGIKTTVHC